MVIYHYKYGSYPREFKIKFKKLFGISFISEDGVIILEEGKTLNREKINLFDSFYEVCKSLSRRNSFNWISFCQLVYDLNKDFYKFLESRECGIK